MVASPAPPGGWFNTPGPLRASGAREVHWPEGNALLGRAVDPDSREPDFNATVTMSVWQQDEHHSA